MLFIPFTDGMTGGSESLATTARARAPKTAKGVTTFAIMSGTRPPPRVDQQLGRYGLQLRHRR